MLTSRGIAKVYFWLTAARIVGYPDVEEHWCAVQTFGTAPWSGYHASETEVP